MKASEQLRRPENWQDFEKLCLKLWGAIWNKPEGIEFNSSNSQGQDGVDIYCRVDSENGYIGIQCKNLKEEKLNGKPNNIILRDIKHEIALAEQFEPSLKRYIIATSAEKDGEIQKEVRIISEKRIAEGKFPVEIKFWDYISMKVDEHKSVHDWYVKSINFKTNHSIKFSFIDNSNEKTASPFFKKLIEQPSKWATQIYRLDGYEEVNGKLVYVYKYNKSYIPLQFKMINTGEQAIEEWKVNITIEGEFQEISKTNKVDTVEAIIPNLFPDYSISTNPPHITLARQNKVMLVGGDEFKSNTFFIKPIGAEEKSTIKLKWELLSKNYRDNGILLLNIDPKVEEDSKYTYNENDDAPDIITFFDYLCKEEEL